MTPIETYTAFRSSDDGHVYCTRNTPPRFTAQYTPGRTPTSDVRFLEFLDELPGDDPAAVARIMRELGESIAEFLQNE